MGMGGLLPSPISTISLQQQGLHYIVRPDNPPVFFLLGVNFLALTMTKGIEMVMVLVLILFVAVSVLNRGGFWAALKYTMKKAP
jgi:hypothetical protein